MTRPRSDLTMEKIDGDLVLLDNQRNQIHQLNATASVVWEGLAAGDTTAAIADRLLDEFDTSTDVVLSDIDGIVKDFENLGLLDGAGD